MIEEVRRTGTNSCRPFGPLKTFGYCPTTPLRTWLFHSGPSGLRPIVIFRAARTISFLLLGKDLCDSGFSRFGYPIYDVTWSWNSAKQLRINFVQKQEKPVFRMPIDVKIKSGELVRRETIEVKELAQSFTFNLDSKPTGLSIDPGEHVLKTLRVKED